MPALHTYEGKDITVTYDKQKCIHAAVCVKELGACFDIKKKPWVQVDQASADEVAATVAKCPSGALQFKRHDGGAEEQIPATNSVRVDPNGPLVLHGNIQFMGEDGEVETHTRLTLCRCGASKNKPFCDNSHTEAAFVDDGTLGENKLKPAEGDIAPPLVMRLAGKGPVLIEGPIEVAGAGSETHAGVKGALCRCGASKNKPYCDGTHKEIGWAPGD